MEASKERLTRDTVQDAALIVLPHQRMLPKF